MNISLNKKIVKFAYDKGYRVREDGRTIAPSGRELLCNAMWNGYLSVTIKVRPLTGENKPRRLMVHLLAAYQVFGYDVLGPNIRVRHLNGDVQDMRLANISIRYINAVPAEPRQPKAAPARPGRPAQTI